MEIIVIITKEVADTTAARNFAAQVKAFVNNSPVLSDPSVRVQMEFRGQLEPE